MARISETSILAGPDKLILARISDDLARISDDQARISDEALRNGLPE